MSKQIQIEAIRHIVGQENIQTSVPAKIAASTPYRDGNGQSDFLAVVDPADVEEIYKLVQYCAKENIAITIQGGLTSLTKASIPNPALKTREQIIVRTHRMNKIIDMIRNDQGTITAVKLQPGVTLDVLNQHLKPLAVQVPIGLGIGFKAQMGGIVSTNAGGTEAAFRGRPDSLVLALEVVTADGCRWRLPNEDFKAPKMTDLIGQEGTIGMITSIVIAVAPLAVKRKVMFVETDSMQHLHQLLNQFKQCVGPYLNAFERIDDNVLKLMRHYYHLPDPFLKHRVQDGPAKYNILIELATSDNHVDLDTLATSTIAQAKTKSFIQSVWIGANDEEASEIWSYRTLKLSESINKRSNEINGKIVAFDLGLPEGDDEPFPSPALQTKLKSLIPEIEFYSFGHAAGGGSGGTFLHFDPIVPKGTDQSHIESLEKFVYEEMRNRHGNIAAEHGIGYYKQKAFKHYCNNAYSERLLRKKMFDPTNLFNPGKVFAIEDV